MYNWGIKKKDMRSKKYVLFSDFSGYLNLGYLINFQTILIQFYIRLH